MQRFILLSVFIWGGCGAPVDPVKGYTSIWESNCDALERCANLAPEEDWDWANQRLADCASTIQTDETWSVMFREAVELGNVTYDRSTAKACMKENKSISCGEFWTEFDTDTCGDVFVGQLGCGVECSIHQECASSVCRGNLCDCSI